MQRQKDKTSHQIKNNKHKVSVNIHSYLYVGHINTNPSRYICPRVGQE